MDSGSVVETVGPSLRGKPERERNHKNISELGHFRSEGTFISQRGRTSDLRPLNLVETVNSSFVTDVGLFDSSLEVTPTANSDPSSTILLSGSGDSSWVLCPRRRVEVLTTSLHDGLSPVLHPLPKVATPMFSYLNRVFCSSR